MRASGDFFRYQYYGIFKLEYCMLLFTRARISQFCVMPKSKMTEKFSVSHKAILDALILKKANVKT